MLSRMSWSNWREFWRVTSMRTFGYFFESLDQTRQQVIARAFVGANPHASVLETLQFLDVRQGLVTQAEQPFGVGEEHLAGGRQLVVAAARPVESGDPSSSSSLRIAMLTAGWVRNTRSDARCTLRSSAVATNISSCIKSMWGSLARRFGGGAR